ncbi:unnamed protein product, partial [Prorocentrum cordatum]
MRTPQRCSGALASGQPRAQPGARLKGRPHGEVGRGGPLRAAWPTGRRGAARETSPAGQPRQERAATLGAPSMPERLRSHSDSLLPVLPLLAASPSAVLLAAAAAWAGQDGPRHPARRRQLRPPPCPSAGPAAASATVPGGLRGDAASDLGKSSCCTMRPGADGLNLSARTSTALSACTKFMSLNSVRLSASS